MKDILTTNSKFDLTSKSTFSSESITFTSKSFAALCAKNRVPQIHKEIADNYIIIKKIFKFQTGMGKITNVEKALLEKYDFSCLEYTTVKQMYDELELLQHWSSGEDKNLKNVSEEILRIRVKELKSLESNSYVTISNEIYSGYKALAQYLREISKFETMSLNKNLSI